MAGPSNNIPGCGRSLDRVRGLIAQDSCDRGALGPGGSCCYRCGQFGWNCPVPFHPGDPGGIGRAQSERPRCICASDNGRPRLSMECTSRIETNHRGSEADRGRHGDLPTRAACGFGSLDTSAPKCLPVGSATGMVDHHRSQPDGGLSHSLFTARIGESGRTPGRSSPASSRTIWCSSFRICACRGTRTRRAVRRCTVARSMGRVRAAMRGR